MLGQNILFAMEIPILNGNSVVNCMFNLNDKNVTVDVEVSETGECVPQPGRQKSSRLLTESEV